MVYRFAQCELDADRHRLLRDGEEVHVEPQVFDLLLALAHAAPALLTYDDMIAQVWGGRIVSDATLSARISAARASVGDNGKAQGVIRTVPRRGIQLIVPCVTTASPEASALDPTRDSAPPLHSPIAEHIRYTASRDGTRIAYAVSDTEGPPLLRAGHWLTHLEDDWASPVWRPWLERLGQGRKLIRYDVRSTGLSDRGVRDLSMQAYLDDMIAVIDASGAERVDVFATSQSVPVTLAYAARFPDRVRRLILLNGFVQGSILRGEVEETEAIIGLIRSGWGQADSPFFKAFSTLFLPESEAHEVASYSALQAASASAEDAARMRRAIGHFDATEVLDRVKAEVLVLSAKGDAIHPARQSQALARSIAGAELRHLDTRNHAIPPSDPAFQVATEAIDQFLRRP